MKGIQIMDIQSVMNMWLCHKMRICVYWDWICFQSDLMLVHACCKTMPYVTSNLLLKHYELTRMHTIRDSLEKRLTGLLRNKGAIRWCLKGQELWWMFWSNMPFPPNKILNAINYIHYKLYIFSIMSWMAEMCRIPNKNFIFCSNISMHQKMDIETSR